MKATPREIDNTLDAISGLSKFHSEVHLFFVGLVQFKYNWGHVRPCEVFKTAKLLSQASNQPWTNLPKVKSVLSKYISSLSQC